MKAILIDDESLAMEYLEGLLLKVGDIQIVGKYTNPHQAIEGVFSEKPNVVFLDIEMPEKNGIEVAEEIQSSFPETHIIFVTAFNEYAVQAFELNAVDYVIKPVQFERLSESIKRISKDIVVETPISKGKMVCAFQSLTFTDCGNVSEAIPIHWRTSKVKGVFIYLLHHRGSFVRKDVLLDLFWPDADWEKGYMQLYSTIYQIRKSLSAISFDIDITSQENGYRLNLNRVKFDVVEWENGLKESSTVTPETLPMHLYLLDRYRGDYLSEEDYVWTENERERLRILWLHHISTVADYFVADKRFSEAISLHLRIQNTQPYNDFSYFKLMQLYGTLGDAQSVEQQYLDLQKMMSSEYDASIREEIQSWFDHWTMNKEQFLVDLSK